MNSKPSEYFRIFLFSLIGCLSFALAPNAQAWGCKGHQTVALIAEKHLTREAKQLVDKLLSENPADSKTGGYCGNSVHDAMANAATWADDVRTQKKNGPWHYIDIPRGSKRDSLDKFCGEGGCVTKALSEQLAILKDPNSNPAVRTDALRYVIHFVGDLHQPLHAITNDDEGGNCVPLKYLRRKPHERNNSYSPNLHSIWDTAILERDMEGADPVEYANTLEEIFQADLAKWQKTSINVDDWVWESFDLAENTVYEGLVPKIPVESPTPVQSCTDDNNIGQRMLLKNISVDETYQVKASQVSERRVAQAGVRLAMILNQAAKPTE